MAGRLAENAREGEQPMDARSAPSSPRSRRAQLNERRGEIIKVFAEAGFADLLAQAGLMRHAPVGRRADQAAEGLAPAEADRPERLRLALERLGGAFVKIGQLLSVRPDLIPPEYASELDRLRDDVAPMPFATVREIVESELECELSEAYRQVSESPLGSASISQVHAAELEDGTKVAVKVQRPETPALIDLDLELMTRAARALAASPWGEDLDPVGAAGEFAQALRSELDFTAEARQLDTFGEFFANDDTVTIPAVHWSHTTGRLLTESRLDGITLGRPADISAAGGDVHALVDHGVNAYLRMVFELRRFHSDPHPGNLVALPGDAIGFLDFGRVSTLSEPALDRSAECLAALARNDAVTLTDVVMEMTYAGPDVDRERLRLQIQALMDRYAGADTAHMSGLSALSQVIALLRNHHLRLPPEYVMLFQTLGVLEGVVLGLDPGTKLLDVMKPYITRVVTATYTPQRMAGDLIGQAKQYVDLMARLPDALSGILRRLTTGEPGVHLTLDATDDVLDRTESAANRFSLTVLLSAMAIALAVATGQPALPSWLRYVGLGLLLLVFFVAVWLLVSIASAERRSRRRRSKRSGAR